MGRGLKIFYLFFAFTVLSAYVAAAFSGWEATGGKTSKMGPSARSSASGGRYYHSGYRGGK